MKLQEQGKTEQAKKDLGNEAAGLAPPKLLPRGSEGIVEVPQNQTSEGAQRIVQSGRLTVMKAPLTCSGVD